MALKQAYICAALLLPLAGGVWVITGNINIKFRPVFRASSLTSAHEKDEQITKFIHKNKQSETSHLGTKKQINDAYLPPIMCIKYKSHKSKSRKNKNNINDSKLSFAGAAQDDDNEDDHNSASYQNFQNLS